MFRTRRMKLITYLQNEQSVDVALIMSPLHIYYYTGFLSNPHERFFALAVDMKTEKTILFVPALDVEAARRVVDVVELIPINDSENPYTILKNNLRNDINSFALEKSYLSLIQYEQLKETFPEAIYKNIEDYIHRERMHKSPDEIKHVKKAI